MKRLAASVRAHAAGIALASSPGARRRWRLVVGALGLLVIGALAGVLGATRFGGDGGGQRVEDLGGGRVRVVDTAGTGSLSITGPAEVAVGGEARFAAAASGTNDWVWTMPNGDVLTNDAEVRIRASTPGVAELALRARTADGDDLVASHGLRIVDKWPEGARHVQPNGPPIRPTTIEPMNET